MIHIEVGPVATVTIDRVAALNALDVPALRDLEQAFDRLEADQNVRVIVVTGAGERAFVAGGDIADLNSRRGLDHYREFAEVIHRVLSRIERCAKPTIAAVRGYALGGGVELLLALDLRVVAEDAVFGLPEITLGIFPGAGGSQRLMRQISPCLAKELMFTGDRISAHRAATLGLVNRVVPAADVLDEARSLGERIATFSPLTLGLLKRTVTEGIEMPLRSALSYEQAMIGLAFDTEDAHEGCQAFLDGRPPSFAGA